MARHKVFISYRRDDSSYVATSIRDELESRMGKGSVFFDVDSISPGQDFIEKLESSLCDSDAVLAVIGDHWNSVKDQYSPLEDPADFVRLELERAFKHNLLVIPVLIGKARMPSEEQLPRSLAKLPRCQAFELRSGPDFKNHLQLLAKRA